jgi:hypothetical protein
MLMKEVIIYGMGSYGLGKGPPTVYSESNDSIGAGDA